MTEQEHQPTTEQCLHSIALSLINIHEEVVKMRRYQRESLQLAKSQATQRVIRPAPSPKKRSFLTQFRSMWSG